MGIYARHPRRLVGQVSADLFVLVWSVVWWLVSRLVRSAVLNVATPARETADAATRLSAQVAEVAERAGQVPGLGEQLRQPLDGASGSLTDVIAAAQRQVASIERLADLMGWLVFAIPVTIVVALWLPRRIAFFVRARAARRFLDSNADLDLFALRALANQPMHVLARISDDPVAAWRARDATVIHKLAEVELRRSGLRVPTTRPSPPA